MQMGSERIQDEFLLGFLLESKISSCKMRTANIYFCNLSYTSLQSRGIQQQHIHILHANLFKRIRCSSIDCKGYDTYPNRHHLSQAMNHLQRWYLPITHSSVRVVSKLQYASGVLGGGS